MNIKEAKMEVEKAVKVYLEKDENGEYVLKRYGGGVSSDDL